MAAPSGYSNSSDKWILPAAISFPDPRDLNIEVGESSSQVVLLSENTVEVPVLDWETASEMKLPLPLPHTDQAHHKKRRSPPSRSRVSLTLDKAIEYELKHGRDLNPNMDTRTLRRTVSNRLAAQRSRMRRSQCLAGLQNQSIDFVEVIDDLTPRVAAEQERLKLLQEENEALRTAWEVRAHELKLAEDLTCDLQREIARLKQLVANGNPPNEVMMVEPAAGGGGLTGPQPYSLQFYQQRLMQMPVFPTWEVAPAESDSFIGLISFDDEEGDVEVDQYLNLDQVYVDAHPQL